MSEPAQLSWFREAVKLVRESPCCVLLVAVAAFAAYEINLHVACRDAQEEARRNLRNIVTQELLELRRRTYDYSPPP